MTPRELGKYTLLHHLASGGMAELYLARSRELIGVERLLVLKLVSRRYAEDASFIAMFEDEVRIAATLSHPNIGQVIDAGCVQGTCYLAMEHIHGKDLRSIFDRCLQRGHAVPIPIAAHIGARICAALHYAHEARGLGGQPLGIVHRDVSPSNIMVTVDGEVKLVDFGIAKAANRSSLTMPGMIKGKLRYLAPEQVTGRPVDRRADLFTLATSLWEATLGRHLFGEGTDAQVFRAISTARVPAPSSVGPGYPEAMERVLLRALSANPDDRYQTARAMQLDLEAFGRQAGVAVGSIELARFLSDIFPDEVGAWRRAESQGQGLVDFLRSLPTETSDPEAEVRPSLTSMPVAASATHPTILEAPRTEVSERRRTLYFDGKRSPTSPKPTVQRPGAAVGGTLTEPPLYDGPTLHEPEQAIRSPAPGGAASSPLMPVASPVIYGGAEPPNVAEPVLLQDPVPAAAEPIIGRDLQELEEKRADRPAGEEGGRLLIEQGTESGVMRRPPTGDWSHQLTAPGQRRAGTHPYFSGPLPAAEREEERLPRTRVWLPVLIGGAVVLVLGGAALLGHWVKQRRSAGPVEPALSAAPAVVQPMRRVELTSDPTGATVYTATDGRELGKTPLAVDIKDPAGLRVQLHLAGYQSQTMMLSLTDGARIASLVRETVSGAASKPVGESPSKASGSSEDRGKRAKPTPLRRPKLGPAKKRVVEHDDLRNPFD